MQWSDGPWNSQGFATIKPGFCNKAPVENPLKKWHQTITKKTGGKEVGTFHHLYKIAQFKADSFKTEERFWFMQKCVQNKYRSCGRPALTNKHFSTFPAKPMVLGHPSRPCFWEPSFWVFQNGSGRIPKSPKKIGEPPGDAPKPPIGSV